MLFRPLCSHWWSLVLCSLKWSLVLWSLTSGLWFFGLWFAQEGGGCRERERKDNVHHQMSLSLILSCLITGWLCPFSLAFVPRHCRYTWTPQGAVNILLMAQDVYIAVFTDFTHIHRQQSLVLTVITPICLHSYISHLVCQLSTHVTAWLVTRDSSSGMIPRFN